MNSNIVVWNTQSVLRLFKLSLFSIINESCFPIALFIELALIANALTQDGLAAYAAISATVTFAVNIFNFLVTVTMAQVSKTVGGKYWPKVGTKLRIAISTGLIVGCLCAISLYYLSDSIFEFMGLSSEVKNLAIIPFQVRLVSLPLKMMQRVCVGTLGGYQRLKILAGLAFLVSILEVLSQYYALYVLRGGLLAATIGCVIVSGIGCLVSFCLVLCCPPQEADGKIRLLPTTCCFGNLNKKYDDEGALTSVTLLMKENKDTENVSYGGCMNVFLEFMSASSDTTIRSILLTGSVYSMSVFAGNLGTSALAAHQIAITLWMVTSYVCDGVADVGTMIGANLLGSNEPDKFNQIIALRNILMFFGLIVGFLAGLGMFFFREDILSLFNVNDVETTNLLLSLWPVLCSMQLINACVFVLDGLIYAAHAFRFVRNLMIISCVGVFAPLLFVVSSVSIFHSLFYVWIAKTALNSMRAIGAFWLWYISLPRKWERLKTKDEKE
jgi:Na+-driven multidrug efflux pump